MDGRDGLHTVHSGYDNGDYDDDYHDYEYDGFVGGSISSS